MARIIVLDSGPLGLAAHRPNITEVRQCLAWLARLEVTGARIVLSEIADYVAARALLRPASRRVSAGSTASRLASSICRSAHSAMLQAAAFWADVRHRGIPTASPDALDADCILAGMAATAFDPGDTVSTIATNNVVHLIRFSGIDARGQLEPIT